jgi:RNA polymerase sigma-70 factor (ECF subfamily)
MVARQDSAELTEPTTGRPTNVVEARVVVMRGGGRRRGAADQDECGGKNGGQRDERGPRRAVCNESHGHLSLSGVGGEPAVLAAHRFSIVGSARLTVAYAPPVETANARPVIDERRLIEQLRGGDESAYARLVEELTPGMLRVARTYVPTDAVAADVVQETWLGVLRGLDGFEARSSLKTWVYRILINQASTRGVAEHRTVPFATLAARETDIPFAAVDGDRFLPADHDRWPHHWAAPPRRWELSPEDALSHSETLEVIRAAIDELPPMQRMVIVMRDLEGFSAEEACELLELSAGNQRVLLHRARSHVRAHLEEYLAP